MGASDRFRSISWGVIAQHMGNVVCRNANNTMRERVQELQHLANPCQFAGCDIFVSHSSMDDWSLKWVGLKAFCEDFLQAQRRAPLLWIDAVCIDRKNIALDLECLPIFLAASNLLTILCGPTYVSRLWCVVELFVFTSIQAQGKKFDITVLPLAVDACERRAIWATWDTFDAESCMCFDPDDRRIMMHAINCFPGNVGGFNHAVKKLAKS